MDSLRDRLAIVKLYAGDGVSSRRIDRCAGISEGHLDQILSGKKLNLTLKTFKALIVTLGLSADWVLFGRGKAPTQKTVREALGRFDR